MASFTGTGQVFDSEHSDDSISDIDISALLDHSDQKLSLPSTHSVNSAKAGGSGRASGGTGGKGSNSSVSQNYINQIILAQLGSLGERLDSMEKNYVKGVPKKTSDMSKVKSSVNKSKRAKAQVTSGGFDTDDIHTSGPMHNIPPPDRLREEARIQTEV